jgi:hypothetical protein
MNETTPSLIGNVITIDDERDEQSDRLKVAVSTRFSTQTIDSRTL